MIQLFSAGSIERLQLFLMISNDSYSFLKKTNRNSADSAVVNCFSTFCSRVSCFQWSHLIHIAFSIKPFGIQRIEMFSIVFLVFSSGFCFFLRTQLFTATSNGRNSFYNQTHWCSAGLIVFSGVSAVLSGVNCFQWFPMIHIALSIKHRDSADTAIFNFFQRLSAESAVSCDFQWCM